MKQSRILIIGLLIVMQSMLVLAFTTSTPPLNFYDALGETRAAQTIASVTLTADAAPVTETTVSFTTHCTAVATCLDGAGTTSVGVTSNVSDNTVISNIFSEDNLATFVFSGETLTLLDNKVSPDGAYRAALFLGSAGNIFLLNVQGDNQVNSFVSFNPAGPEIFTDGEMFNVENSGNVNIIAESNRGPNNALNTYQINAAGTATIARGFTATSGSMYLGTQSETNDQKAMYQSTSFISGTGFAAVGQVAVTPGQFAAGILFFNTALVEQSGNSRKYDTASTNDAFLGVANDGSQFFTAGIAGNDFYMTNNGYNAAADFDNRFDPITGATALFNSVAVTDAIYIGGNSNSGSNAVLAVFDATSGATTASFNTSAGTNDIFDIEEGINNAGGYFGINTNEGGSNTYYSVYETDNSGNVNAQAGYGIGGAQGNNMAVMPGGSPALPQLFVSGYQDNKNKKFIQGFRIDPGLDPLPLLFVFGVGAGGGVPIVAASDDTGETSIYLASAYSGFAFLAGFDASFNGNVPEFSAGTLLLALLASGFLMMFVMRRNQ